MIEKKYHIYIKDKCIYHSLSENEFQETLNTLRNFLSIVSCDVKIEDIDYEEVLTCKEFSLNSSY